MNEKPSNTRIWFASLIFALCALAVRINDDHLAQPKLIPDPWLFAYRYGPVLVLVFVISFIAFKIVFQHILPFMRNMDNAEILEEYPEEEDKT